MSLIKFKQTVINKLIHKTKTKIISVKINNNCENIEELDDSKQSANILDQITL